MERYGKGFQDICSVSGVPKIAMLTASSISLSCYIGNKLISGWQSSSLDLDSDEMVCVHAYWPQNTSVW